MVSSEAASSLAGAREAALHHWVLMKCGRYYLGVGHGGGAIAAPVGAGDTVDVVVTD